MRARTALLSVTDKSGLVPFAKGLLAHGYRLLSTGGTAKALVDAGLSVETVETYTGSPEVMAGRVKTLHPRVHGGILARGEVDAADLERLGGRFIDLLVVNLYPFAKVASTPGATREEVIENIDIGGPSMIRSAAKNHARVCVVCDPADYDAVLSEIAEKGDVSEGTRRTLSAKAFFETARYDARIAEYLTQSDEGFSECLALPMRRSYGLRYGENPHQRGAFYLDPNAGSGTIALAKSLGTGAKELSYNNLVDADAALECVREFSNPGAVIVKHTNPCGVAVADTLAKAYRGAREADSLSAFGGIAALNRPVDEETARLLAETFLECVIAPSFDEAALSVLREKKNLRLLAVGEILPGEASGLTVRSVSGGFLLQSRDNAASFEVENGVVVTKRSPTNEERAALSFAWRVCKHVKSNAIVLAQGQSTVGIGAGQMSRVVSVEIACAKAKEKCQGAALASDAFFPFPDGLEAAARAGVSTVAQPGGSVKDAEVIAAADRLGLAMVFTKVRHFRH